MISFIKKHWLLMLLAFLAVILGFAWFLGRTTPPSLEPARPELPREVIEPPSSSFSPTVTEATFSIAIPPPAVPEKVEIFEIEKFTKTSIFERFPQVFLDLGISPSQLPREIDPGFLLWETDSSSLLINLPSGRFAFSGRAKKTSGFTSASAQSFAFQVADSWKLFESIVPLKTTSLKIVEGHTFETRSPAETQLFSVSLGATVGQLAVVRAGIGSEVIEFKLSRDGEINSVNFNLHFPKASRGFRQTRAWGEALADLNQGRGQILWIKDLQGNLIPPLEEHALKSSTINQVYLAYFESDEEAQDFFQPVFVFEGTGETVNGDKRTLAVFVPAVK